MIISQLISTCHIGVYDFMNQYSQLYIMYWVCRVAHQELKSYFCNPHYKMELSKSRQLVKNLAKFSDLCSLGLAKSVCSDLGVENSLVTGHVTRLFWNSSDYIINLALVLVWHGRNSSGLALFLEIITIDDDWWSIYCRVKFTDKHLVIMMGDKFLTFLTLCWHNDEVSAS